MREELAQLLDEQEMAAARRTVINSHYTDAALVQVIWDAVTELGFTEGQVLEPGCGSGNFLAFAPDTAKLTGVELDPVTAAIAAALYPNATILNESFAGTRVATGSVDLTIGNVPFGGVRLHDKRDNGGNHAIHNHFIIKSLRATRPGGLVAVITSAYTLDAVNPAARREMQAMGDLVGAVRLPSRAHAKAAGTDALTDVLVFRRRGEHEPAADFGWEYTGQAEVDGIALSINTYFLDHPQRVLGQLAARDGLYRSEELSISGDPAAAPAQLRERLAEIIQQAQAAGLAMTPGQRPVAAPPAAALPRTARRPDGFLRANDDGTFSRLDDGTWEPYQVPKTQAPELRDLLRLRDTALALLEAEAASLDDTAAIDQLRAELNQRYDAYAGPHGAINRYTDVQARRKYKTTSKMVPAVDEETGEPILRRTRPPAVSRFRSDPFAPVVAALELFNDETQTATKVDIFTQRVVAPRPARLGADTPDEALAICLDEHGEVRLDVVGWLLGLDEQATRVALGSLVFADPATGRLEIAAAYLSGDVKTKLALARAAAVEDTAYTVNVTALAEVVPRDLNPDEITIKMDAPWLGADYIQQFLTEILDDTTVKVEHGGGVLWSVSARSGTVAATSTWGTERRSAAEIAQTILEQREFVIKDTVERNGEKRQVVNLDAIMEATEKAVEMKERFSDWVWEDAERTATLVAKYNDLFRRYVPRDYSGTTLSLPGLAMAFKPDPHQVAAVARIIHEPAVGLYHSVGAGKTADMIMGAMELRRLGLATKPVIIVPNQLIDQWLREFLRLYPQAKILATASENLTGASAAKTAEIRRQTVARMATGDWDAVLLTESAFEMLPMSPAAEEAYLKGELADLTARIEEAEAAGAETVLKRLETKKANREERIKGRLDNIKDAGIWWELTGIDYLFRDESHRDKNLRTVSNVPGMSIPGSQRATQMDMKLAWLRERQPRWGTRATGTPIANSIIELYTEFKYLRPDLMQELGVIDIDSFLATFADGETVIEVTPDGGGLRNKVRHKFFNLDDLITSTRVFADVKTKDELDLDRPPLAERADGQRAPDMVIVPPSMELLGKVAELVDRAGKLKGRRPGKGEDNILKIVGEGAAAALDLELVGLHTGEPQKLDVAADHIAQIYRDNATRVYAGADGEPHPTPGALQMVFCDLGTPSGKPGKFNGYAKLRRLLTAQGVPADKIRFIHEATNDRERAELFAACRDGRVAVLVGSTEKMGTGVNVQDRLLALHHLDCPWRPCDLEQREGRIDRRGNQNPEIRILRYSVERSLDAFRWQKVAHKARLADQVLLGQAGRESDDIGDTTLSYEEMKAATTGNPLLIEHAEAKTHLNRLERLERGYHRNRSQLTWTIRNSNEEITINRALIADVTAAIAGRQATRGDAFTMTVHGQTYTKRREANERLHHVLANELRKDAKSAGWMDVGSFAGFPMLVKKVTVYVRIEGRVGTREAVAVALADVPEAELEIFANEIGRADVSTRLENKLAGLEAVRDQAVTDIADRGAQVTRAEHDLTKPFRHADALGEARHLFNRLDAEVKALAAAGDQETGSGEPDDPADTPAHSEAAPELARAKAEPASSPPAAAGVPSRGQARTGQMPAANDTTQPASTKPAPPGEPIAGPTLWVVTTPGLPADRMATVLRNGPHSVDEMLRHLGWRTDSDMSVSRDGQRFTVRSATGDIFDTGQPITLPWRTLQPGESAGLDLGTAGRWHFAEGMSTAGAPWDRHDLRRALQEAENAGAPIAITTWGVVVHHHRTQVFVRQNATIPAVPDVADLASPAGQEPDLLPTLGPILADLPEDQLQWLTHQLAELAGDEHIRAVANANSYERARTVLDEQLDEMVARVTEEPSIADPTALLTAYFDQETVRATFLDTAGRHLYEHARTAGSAAPTDPEKPVEALPAPADPDPATTPPAATRLDQMLTERDITDQPRRWLMGKIGELAEEPVTVQRVHANTEDDAYYGFLGPIEEIFFASVEERQDDGHDLYARLTGGPGHPRAEEFIRAVIAYLYEVVAEPGGLPADGPDTAVPPPPATEANAEPVQPSAEKTGPGTLAEGLPETQRRRRGHDFYPPADILQQIPPLYATDGIPKAEKTIYLHYFGGSRDYWIAEYDPATGEAFGCGGTHNALDGLEWGYSLLPELEELNAGLTIIERDLDWTPIRASDANLPGDWVYRYVPAARDEATTSSKQSPTPAAVEPAAATDAGAGITGQKPAAAAAQVSAHLLARAQEFGRDAYAQDRPLAPAADPSIMALVAGWPVGAGATEVFKAFIDGYTAAADLAAAAILDMPQPAPAVDRPAAQVPTATDEPDRPRPPDLHASDVAGLGDGQPYTSTKRIRGPLRELKTTCNALLRTPGRTSKVGQPLVDTIKAVKQVTIDNTDPTDLLLWTGALALQARAALTKLNRNGDGGTFNMLSGVVRSAETLAADLVATARKPGRWQRLFDQAAPDLTTAGAIAQSPDKQHVPPETPPVSGAGSPPPDANQTRPAAEPRPAEADRARAGSATPAEPAQGSLFDPTAEADTAIAAPAIPGDVTSSGPVRWPLELRDAGWEALDYQVEDATRLLLGDPTEDEVAWAAAVTMVDSFRLSDIALGADQEIGRGGDLDRHEYTYYLGLVGTDVRRSLKADPANRQGFLLPEEAHGLLGRVDPVAVAPISAVKAVISRITGPVAARLHAATDAFRALEARADHNTSSTSLDDPARLAAWHRWKPSYHLLREALVTEVKTAAAAAWRSTRPDTPDRTAENEVLAANVAAVLDNVIVPDEQGRPAVLLAYASAGVRGEVTGYDRDGQPVTASGYFISQRIKTGGLGDAFPGERMRVVVLQEQPGPSTQENALAVVQTQDDARITLIDVPDVGMPGFPYPIPVLRMAEAEQIVAARDVLGWQLEATGSGDNLQWQIRGHQLSTEQALVLLRGSGADAAAGAWAPGFAQRWIEEAIAAGNYRPVGAVGADGTRRMPTATDTGVTPPPDLTEPSQSHQRFTAARDGLDEVRAVLARSRNLGTQVILPKQPLSRPVWEAVHATLTDMGATGGSRIGQPYRFDTNRYDELAAFIAGAPAPKHERTTAGWVRTPDPLAADVVARFAELDALSRPLRVLEPSAGDGSLIRAVLAAAPDAEVTAVEPNPERAAAITAELATHVQHLHTTTIEEYAALWRQRNDQPYELIVMNPPYAVPGNRTSWADHVRLAWSMLAEGGRLVAVLPGRPNQRSDKRSTDLMALLGPDTIVEALPARSFHASGTDFDTSVLAVTKPVTDVGRARARYAASLYRQAEGEPVPVDKPKLTVRDAAETPVQAYRDFSGERVARYVGTCVLCSAPTWSDGSNDPRGMLGANAVQTLRANEHDLDGPDVCRCWSCASTADTYDRSVARARTLWTTPVPQPDDTSLDASIRVATDAAVTAPQTGQAPDPAQASADLPDGSAPAASAADRDPEPIPTEGGELSDLQRQLLTELAKERGEPWSIGRQWRLKTFQKATANDVDGLPPPESEALRAVLRASLDSPDFRERAIARTTLRAWSGAASSLTDAQQQAMHALTHYDMPGTAAVNRYGQLTAEEYLALGDDDLADITADLKTIAASGATKTIPSNRTAYGTTIRGVEADHVSAARYLLGSIGRGVKPHRFHQHADKVGRTVVAIHLNPGDQIMVRGTVMTVDRIGIDDNIRLTGGKGATLKNLTSRYRLVAAAPEPVMAGTSPPDAPTTDTDVAASTREPETPAPEQDAATSQETLFQDPAAPGAKPDTTTPRPAAEPEPFAAASTPRTAHGPSTSAEPGEQHPSAAKPAPNLPASTGAPDQPDRATGPGTPEQGPAPSAGAGGRGPADAGRGAKQGSAAENTTPATIRELHGNEYGTVTGRDGAAAERTATGYISKPSTGGGSVLVTVSAYPDRAGKRSIVHVDLTSPVVVEDPPTSLDVVLWKTTRSGMPVADPAQDDIARGTVIRDPDRERRTQATIAVLAAGLRDMNPDAVPITDGQGRGIGAAEPRPDGTWDARIGTDGRTAPLLIGYESLPEAEEAVREFLRTPALPGDAARRSTTAADPHPAIAPDVPPERSTGATPADKPDLEPIADTVTAAAGDPDPSTEATSMPNTPAPGARALGHIKVIKDGGFARVTGTTGHPDEAPLRDFLKDATNFPDGLRFSLWRDRGEWILRGSTDQAGQAASAVRQWRKPSPAAQPTTAAPLAPSRPAPKPAATARRKASQITLSLQQQAILQAYLDGKNIAVQALAGTGKTSTLVALAEATPGKKIAYFAFNRSIADEAKGKFDPKVVHAATSHSFAKTGLRSHPIAPKLDRIVAGDGWPRDWTARLQITDLIPRRGEQAEVVDKDRIAGAVMATVNAFRLSADPELDTRHLPDHIAKGDRRLRDVVLDHARRAWADKISLEGVLPFSHDDYRKIWALTNPILTHDVIFFDEAQDMPPVMEKVIEDQQAAGKQVVIVGDSQQSIYGFTGASDAIGRWPADVVLPLTQSWRFGAAVADIGNRLLLSLNSPWQLQGNPNLNSAIGHVPFPDAVLARTNSGAVAAVFDAFDQGRKVALVGGSKVIEDIAKAALALQAGRRTSHPDLSGFTRWADVVEAVENDGAQSLRAFVRLVESRGAQELLDMARTLVPEKATTEDGKPAYDVIVCTAHRAKGLEWEFVRIAADFPQPEEDLETGETRLRDAEERRLAYVALTRGRTRTELGSLDYVMSPALDQQDTTATGTTSSRRATPTDAEATIGVVAATEPADTPSSASMTSDADRTPSPVAAPPGPVAGQPTPADPVPRLVAYQMPQEASAEPDTAIAEQHPAVSPTTPEREQLAEQNRSAAEDAMQLEAPGADRVTPRPSSPTPVTAAYTPHDPAGEVDPAVTAPASTSTTARTETPDPESDIRDTRRPVSATPAPRQAYATPANPTAPATDSRPQLAAAAEQVTASPHTSAPSASPEPRIEETVSIEPQDITAAEALPAQDATAERHAPATTVSSGIVRTASAHAEASPDEEIGQQTYDTPSVWQQARLTLAEHTNAPENHLAWALAATAIRAGTADGNWWIAPDQSAAPVIDGVIEGNVNDNVRFRADRSGARLEQTQDGTVLFAADWNRLLRILAPEQATALATVTKAAADARRKLAEFATAPWERLTKQQQKLTMRWEAARDIALETIGRIWSAFKAALPRPKSATVRQQRDQLAATDVALATAEPARVVSTVRDREPLTAPERLGPDQGDVPATGSNDSGAAAAAADSSNDRVNTSPMQRTDLAHIRLVVIDTAAEYFDSSRAYGIAGTAVHLAQHHLQDETDRFGLIPVVQAAADVMHQDESVLTRSAEQRQTARHDRNSQSEMFADLIRSLAGAGNNETALRLIAEAELLNPRHRTTWAEESDLGWDEVSDRVRNRAHPAAQAFTPLPGSTPATAGRPIRVGPGQAFTAAGNRGAPTPGIRRATPPQTTPAGSRRHR